MNVNGGAVRGGSIHWSLLVGRGMKPRPHRIPLLQM